MDANCSRKSATVNKQAYSWDASNLSDTSYILQQKLHAGTQQHNTTRKLATTGLTVAETWT
jgi:hypothetical protein